MTQQEDAVQLFTSSACLRCKWAVVDGHHFDRCANDNADCSPAFPCAGYGCLGFASIDDECDDLYDQVAALRAELDGKQEQAYLAEHLTRPGAIPDEVTQAATQVSMVQEAEARAESEKTRVAGLVAEIEHLHGLLHERRDAAEVKLERVIGLVNEWGGDGNMTDRELCDALYDGLLMQHWDREKFNMLCERGYWTQSPPARSCWIEAALCANDGIIDSEFVHVVFSDNSDPIVWVSGLGAIPITSPVIVKWWSEPQQIHEPPKEEDDE